MKIIFGAHELILHPSGTLLWPAQDLLVVSDLHLEKGSHFAQRGFFLPPYDSRETLERLLAVFKDTSARKLLILGDCFHDVQGYHRLGSEESALFNQLRQFSPIWINGNHDGDYVPAGFVAYEDYTVDGITFRHQAIMNDPALEISGHYHPKIILMHKGGKIDKDCFIEDGKKMILPAFGAYTGGLDVSAAEIQALFPNSFQAHILGASKVLTLKKSE